MQTFEAMDATRYARVKQAHSGAGRRPSTRAEPSWKMTHLPKKRKPKPQQRACLRCDRAFTSEGPDNRLCKGCWNQLINGPSAEKTYRLEVA